MKRGNKTEDGKLQKIPPETSTTSIALFYFDSSHDAGPFYFFSIWHTAQIKDIVAGRLSLKARRPQSKYQIQQNIFKTPKATKHTTFCVLAELFPLNLMLLEKWWNSCFCHRRKNCNFLSVANVCRFLVLIACITFIFVRDWGRRRVFADMVFLFNCDYLLENGFVSLIGFFPQYNRKQTFYANLSRYRRAFFAINSCRFAISLTVTGKFALEARARFGFRTFHFVTIVVIRLMFAIRQQKIRYAYLSLGLLGSMKSTHNPHTHRATQTRVIADQVYWLQFCIKKWTLAIKQNGARNAIFMRLWFMAINLIGPMRIFGITFAAGLSGNV